MQVHEGATKGSKGRHTTIRPAKHYAQILEVCNFIPPISSFAFQYDLFTSIYFKSALFLRRYQCQYGPQNDNAYVQKISPLLLPKRKVKIFATKLSVPDEESTTLLKKKRWKEAQKQNTTTQKKTPCKK